jgi:hypothetical protein
MRPAKAPRPVKNARWRRSLSRSAPAATRKATSVERASGGSGGVGDPRVASQPKRAAIDKTVTRSQGKRSRSREASQAIAASAASAPKPRAILLATARSHRGLPNPLVRVRRRIVVDGGAESGQKWLSCTSES